MDRAKGPHVAAAEGAGGNAALFSGDSLTARLEFSINLSMLPDRKPSLSCAPLRVTDEAPQAEEAQIEAESTQSKRLTLRKLVRSHVRKSDAGNSDRARKTQKPAQIVTERSDTESDNNTGDDMQSMEADHRAPISRDGVNKDAKKILDNSSQFHLDLWSLPSPFTSLGSELHWDGEPLSSDSSLLQQLVSALSLLPPDNSAARNGRHAIDDSVGTSSTSSSSDSDAIIIGSTDDDDDDDDDDIALADLQIQMTPYVDAKDTADHSPLPSLSRSVSSIISLSCPTQPQPLGENIVLPQQPASSAKENTRSLVHKHQPLVRSSLASPANSPSPNDDDTATEEQRLPDPTKLPGGKKLLAPHKLPCQIGTEAPTTPHTAASDPTKTAQPLHTASRADKPYVPDMRRLTPDVPPQRRRSLMFKPLIDVTAVSTLIDTISGTNVEMLSAQTTANVAGSLEPHMVGHESGDGVAIASPVAPHQKIIGSLRRMSLLPKPGGVALVADPTSAKMRALPPRRPLRQYTHDKRKKTPRRAGTAFLRLRERKRSENEIRVVDTIQPDSSAAMHVRVPAALPITRRPAKIAQLTGAAPKDGDRKPAVNDQGAPEPAAAATDATDAASAAAALIGVNEKATVRNRASDLQNESAKCQTLPPQPPPDTAKPSEPPKKDSKQRTPISTKRLKSGGRGADAALPGTTAAKPPAVTTPAQPTQSSDDSQSPRGASSTLGYVPIAVSLKSTRSRQFLLNTPLGEFEVQKTLGQGSYGKVKLMRSAMTNEQFAVKIIKRYPPHKHRRGHQEYRKAKTLDRRVVREANLAAILGQLHPHIVPLHDFRVTDTHFYLFYSYVNGVTLAERVGTDGLSESEARAVFKPVVETISFCHQYSVIHRDIKLENVLIDYSDEAEKARPLLTGASLALSSQRSGTQAGASGGGGVSIWAGVPVLGGLDGMIGRKSASGNALGKKADGQRGSAHTGSGGNEPPEPDYRTASVFDGCVKIIDFGLANFFDGTSLMETFCGSLPYTAPEILRGDAYVGPEIDVWSLGVLLYVMLTGQFPFEDPAQVKNFDKIMAGDFPLRASMSRGLQELLVRMLEPNSKQRITMQGVIKHEWLQSGDPHTTPAGASTLADAGKYRTPNPGICCAHHPYAITDAIHDRRTLTLPGPSVSPLVAREVATCLDRSYDEVMRTLESAMANGETQTRRRRSSQLVSLPSSEIQQWPSALQGLNDSSTLVEVANSPVVSVYALISQQINMRRYYLELPATEHPDANSSVVETRLSNSSQLTQILDASTPGGLPEFADDDESRGHLPPAQNSALPPRPHSLIHRLSAHITNILSHTSSLIGTAGLSSNTASNQASEPVEPVEPNYSIPFPSDRTAAGEGLSMPVLLPSNQQAERRRSLFHLPAQASRVFTHRLSSGRKLPPHTGGDHSTPRIRSIGALEDISSRITLPTDLTGVSAVEVLGLVSKLLKLHEITHTFVETRKMPVQKALGTSMFSLKTIAAMMSSANLPPNPGNQSTPQMPAAAANAAANNGTGNCDADMFMKNSESVYVDAPTSMGGIGTLSTGSDCNLPTRNADIGTEPIAEPQAGSNPASAKSLEQQGAKPRQESHLKWLLYTMFSRSQVAQLNTTHHHNVSASRPAEAADVGKQETGNKQGFDLEIEHAAKTKLGRLFNVRAASLLPKRESDAIPVRLQSRPRLRPSREKRQVHSRNDSRQPSKNKQTKPLSHEPRETAPSVAAGAPAQIHKPPLPATHNVDIPDIITTIPVNYATSVIFAQYSPSLNRWRETEVVEYYSCSVRIELVRIGGSDPRHRYALLVDRMTGHKGKFALFRMFLRRMVCALPSLVPEVFEPQPAADPLVTVI